MSMVVAIDPGLSGAIAVLSPTGDIERLEDLPVSRDGKASWIDGGRLQSLLIDTLHGRPARAVIENVHAMNTWAKGACFNFGMGYGSVLSILQARHIGVERVAPGVWKRALGLSRDKRASLNKARVLFPDAELHLAKHDGRAEALLLAHWALNRTPLKVAA